MKVLIQGAGIAGLGLANALMKKGIYPVIVEKDPKKLPTGYVIYTWDNGRRALRKLGLEKDYDRLNKTVNEFEIVDQKGNYLHTMDFTSIYPRYSLLESVERPEFNRLLQKNVIKKNPIRMDVTVKTIKLKGNSVDVVFSDGSKDKFDLVVGADGVHSTIRKKVFPEIVTTPYNTHIWIYKVKSKKYPKFSNNIVQAVGRGKYVALYPNGKGEHYLYFALNARVGKYNKNNPGIVDLKKEFKNFLEPVPDILKTLGDKKIIYRTDLAKIESKTWVKGNVVIIGDAQHAMSHMLGQASSLALEDACVLANELTNKKHKSIKDALVCFQKKRQERVESMQVLSNKLMYFMRFKALPAVLFRKLFLTKIVEPNFVLKNVEARLEIDAYKD